METAYLLIMLTLGDSGISASFAPASDLGACEIKAGTVSMMLKKGGYKIVDQTCAPSVLKFSRYKRKKSGDGPVNHYLVEFSGETAKITPEHDAASCEKAKAVQTGRIYCVVSRQALLQ